MDEKKMKKIYIVPTGDEIKNGTVLDLDSPEVAKQIIAKFPEAEVTRLCPVIDEESGIFNKIEELYANKPSLIVLIGGSGGGHRFSATLSKDFTHSALEKFSDKFSSHEIYGKNGHMWTKLICSKKEETLIINLPGPFVEAQAAIKAFINAYSQNKEINEISFEMAQAVYNQYPVGKVEELTK